MERKSSWNRLSDAAKKKQNQYRNDHYSVIGCSLPRKTADDFRNYCKRRGVSVSSVLASFVRETLKTDATQDKKTGNFSPDHEKPIDQLGE